MAGHRKKLIEVALPLEEINKQSAREKSIRHGHPSTLHLWWARRPLAACRAVLFASLVDDPGEYMPDEESANAERERLFRLIEQLVNWDNINDERLLAEARLEIARSVARNLSVEVPVGEAAIREFLAEKAPPVLDPFCGGGSIPLEAQRLGLRAYASDLNPVAVLITKALIEIPPGFANRPPVHPRDEGGRMKDDKKDKHRGGAQLPLQVEWKGAAGLAEDVRYYGKWMRDEAKKRIGYLYPKVKLPKEYGGGEVIVIAWLWARTVKCPNPACGATMPLVRSFWLSTKKDKKAWVRPVIESPSPRRGEGTGVRVVRFQVKTGEGAAPDGTVNRRGATCICCDTPVPFDHIRTEGKAGRMGAQLMAIVAQGKKSRVYLSSQPEHEAIAAQAKPDSVPDTDLPEQALGFRVQRYGMTKHRHLFTPRQLVALTTFSTLIEEAQEKVWRDAIAMGYGDGEAQTYADALATYLAFATDRGADYWSSLAIWAGDFVAHTFGRQTLSMIWDFAEANPLSDATGNWLGAIGWIARAIEEASCAAPGYASQCDAATFTYADPLLISTDPPYYDNVGYADLSDFFYVWLRRSVGDFYPSLFNTVLTPKAQELVADPSRHGNSDKARRFFEDGMGKVFANMRLKHHPNYPLTVFYAFKQAETENSPEDESNRDIVSTVASTGWETMLEALMQAGFSINGTWPMRTERPGRLRATGSNALASSIVLVCRPRPQDAPVATRREFIAALKRELPPALKQLQQGAIAPVDLAQATIGPGMAVFSRFSQVLEADGSPMRVRTALALINQALDEYLAEQEGEFDSDTRWALAWFEQFGHNEGPFGDAETLSKAKNTSIEGLVRAGVLEARAGKVRLLRRDEYSPLPPGRSETGPGGREGVWESAQYLIRALDHGGEEAAADLLRRLGDVGQTARDLAYRLYAICERKGWAQEALAYNMLAAAWPRLAELAGRVETKQAGLL